MQSKEGKERRWWRKTKEAVPGRKSTKGKNADDIGHQRLIGKIEGMSSFRELVMLRTNTRNQTKTVL
jgi:hypothetical protein